VQSISIVLYLFILAISLLVYWAVIIKKNRKSGTRFEPLDTNDPLAIEMETMSDVSKSPWSIPRDLCMSKEWVEKGTEKLRYKSLLLKNGDKVADEEETEFAIDLCHQLRMPCDWKVSGIYLIQNETLSSNFDGNLKMIAQRWRVDPKLFRKDDWKVKNTRDLRLWYMQHFDREVEKNDELNAGRGVSLFFFIFYSVP